VVLGVPLVGMALGQVIVLINIYYWDARYTYILYVHYVHTV
jgi:hypothetical protein